MALRDKGPKKKAISDDKCYNCHKLGQFGRDCFLLDRRLNRTTQQSWREESRRRDSRRGRSGIRSNTLNQAHQAVENRAHKHDNDSHPEPFAPGPVGNAFMVRKQRLQKLGTNNTWFLDSYLSHHLCNNRTLFSDLKAKSIDFVTAAGQVIRTEEIGTVAIPLADGNNMEPHNVALAPGCDSNLISLGQLRETEITYHDNSTTMTLIRQGKVIAHAKRTQNLFTLNLAHPGKAMAMTIQPKAMAIAGQAQAMAITGRGRPTHLVSQNKHIRLWHR